MAYAEAINCIKALPDIPASAESLLNLGLRYCLGRDVPKDLVSAHMWFNLAAMRGNESAKQYRVDISREMSAGEIAEAQKQARAWLKTH